VLPSCLLYVSAAKQKLKWGLIVGSALLVICLLMLAANAGLTYAVVRMSQETSVQSSGVMTNKDGTAVVGALGCNCVAFCRPLVLSLHTHAVALALHTALRLGQRP
jgi:hypothetical protein